MKRRNTIYLFPVLVLFLFLFLNGPNHVLLNTATSNQKQFHFAAYKTQLEVRRDANIAVTENLTYHFEGGVFHAAYRYINIYKLENVEDIQVFGPEGAPYKQVDPTEEILPPEQFFVKNELSRTIIQWFYEADARAAPMEMTFTVKYLLTKAVQREGSLDVLDFDGVPADTPKVDSVVITAILPDNFAENQVNIAPNNREDLTQFTVKDGKTILQFSYQNLPDGQAYRIIIGFPHIVQDYFSPKRLINEQAWLISILVVIGSIIFTIYLYIARGRDPTVTVPIERSIKLTPRPPQGLLPGEGVALLKEGRNPTLATLATFADLARQGYVQLEAEEFEDTNPRVVVTKKGEEIMTTGQAELFDFEEKLLKVLHDLEMNQPEPLTMEVLKSSKKVMKTIGDEIMDRTMDAKYFDADPRVVRKSYAKKVTAYSFGALFGPILLIALFRAWGGLILLGSFIVSIFTFVVIISALPRKNERGVMKTKEYEIFLKEVTKRADFAKDDQDPKTAAHLIEEFFPWLLIASIPTSFSLYRWLKEFEKMPSAKKYPYHCSWYFYPHVMDGSGLTAGDSTIGGPSPFSSFAQSFSASLGAIAASMGAAGAGGGFGAGAGAGAGGGAGGGGAGAS